ncbi:MAG TPA: hypothetical protein ENL34_03180 [Chloroflexi bacterium]|nr:hypothetical protein [Chloroflexota bacterium]
MDFARPGVLHVTADLLVGGLVAEVGCVSTRGAVLELQGRVAQNRTLPRVGYALRRACSLVEDLLAYADRSLLGIAIGVPGLADAG